MEPSPASVKTSRTFVDSSDCKVTSADANTSSTVRLPIWSANMSIQTKYCVSCDDVITTMKPGIMLRGNCRAKPVYSV